MRTAANEHGGIGSRQSAAQHPLMQLTRRRGETKEAGEREIWRSVAGVAKSSEGSDISVLTEKA